MAVLAPVERSSVGRWPATLAVALYTSVRGRTATFWKYHEGGQVRLAWTESASSYILDTDSSTIGGLDAARELLIRVAESLRPPQASRFVGRGPT